MMQIENLTQLKELLPEDFYNGIIEQAKEGDPDWLIDMIEELDTITIGSPFYIKDFHGVLIEKGLKTENFNIEAITQELLNL